MRTGYAANTVAALAVLAAGAMGAALMIPESATPSSSSSKPDSSSLVSSTWSAEMAPDFGTTFSEPIVGGLDALHVQVDTAALRQQAYYQPYTVRTSRGSTTEGYAQLGTGALVAGDPAAASALRVRAVLSPDGTCASSTFERSTTSLLAGDNDSRQPVDTPATDTPIRLEAATATTAGPPATICLELSVDRAVAAPASQVALMWPMSISNHD